VKDCQGVEAIGFRGEAYCASKRYWYGTQRTTSPEETLEKIQPYFKKAGITRIANITGLDRIDIPTTSAIRPNSPTLANSAGKGFTLVAAIVSAAMEAIEVYHAENIHLPTLRLSYEQLGGNYAVIPVERLLFNKNALFQVSWPYDWILGWDIAQQNEVAVPLLMVDVVRNRALDLTPFHQSSNGLASGNHLLEAISAGLFEVIERDAMTCYNLAWRTHGHPPPLVRLETIEHPLVLELLDRLKMAEVAAVLFDYTTDTGVPVYAAYIYDLGSRHFGIAAGQGAHLDPEIAMIRALTEAVQARAVYISGARDDTFRYTDQRIKWTDNRETIRALRAMTPTVDARERRSQATATFEGDIRLVIERLRAVGLDQVIVVDLTHPEFPIRAVKVIVPGLESYLFDHYEPGQRARMFCEMHRQRRTVGTVSTIPSKN